MHMVRHQAGRNETGTPQIVRQHVAIFAIVGIIGEEVEAGTRTLHDVMRDMGKDYARESRHGMPSLRGKVLMPVARNVDAPWDPHFLMILHMIKKALQRQGPARPADEAAMQADRHHLG